MDRPSFPGEQWLPVVGHEGLYDVSSLGRVWSYGRSVPHVHGSVRHVKPRIMKLLRGYEGRNRRPKAMTVGLSHGVGDPSRHYGVHALMLRAFVGEAPIGKTDGCHRDGDPFHNTLENIYWGSRKENCADTIRHGRTTKGVTTQSGAQCYNAVLTDDDIRCIRAEPKYPGVLKMLGDAFGYAPTNIWKIRTGRAWRHVPQHL